MARIFILFTQLRNQTQWPVRFQVDDGYSLLPDLPPGKSRMVKLYRILRFSRERGSLDWKIRVLLNDQFTGIELDQSVLLFNVRILFNEYGADVLGVEGVREKRSDIVLRHKYFGCMRNFFWDDRAIHTIARSDSRLATKLRYLEGDAHPSAPFVDTPLLKKRQCASPVSKLGDKNTTEEKTKTDHLVYKKSPLNYVRSPPVISRIIPRPQPAPPLLPENLRNIPGPRTLPHSPLPLQGRRSYDYYFEDSSGHIDLDDEYSSSDGESDSLIISSDDDEGDEEANSVPVADQRERVPDNVGNGMQARSRREQLIDRDHRCGRGYIDIIDHAVLFLFAFTLAWYLPKLFA